MLYAKHLVTSTYTALKFTDIIMIAVHRYSDDEISKCFT